MTDNITEEVIKQLVNTVAAQSSQDDYDPFVDSDNENTGALGNETSTSLDADEEPKAPDLIANIYQSMSKIIEALNTDNALLNRQVDKIRKELEFVCNTLSVLKNNQEEMSSTYIAEVGQIKDVDIVELRKKINTIAEIQKHVMETRNMLMQTLESNMKTIKKELSEMRNNKPLVQSIIEDEVNSYLARNPITTAIEQRIEANLTIHVKKAMLLAMTDMLK